jgi:hypothetical protein
LSLDYLRDYTTAAFKFYARNGKSTEKYKKKIYLDAIENGMIKSGLRSSGISSPTEAMIIAAEREVNNKLAEIQDMESVERTLAELFVLKRYDILQAVDIVYFKDCVEKNEDIKAKVHQAEIFIPASERSIYRWLKIARNTFATERGLRIE